MKQIFILFKQDANNVKSIKEIYLAKDKAQGEFVCKILTDNQDPDSKIVYSFEAQDVYQRAARVKKTTTVKTGSSKGRMQVATTKDTVL